MEVRYNLDYRLAKKIEPVFEEYNQQLTFNILTNKPQNNLE